MTPSLRLVGVTSLCLGLSLPLTQGGCGTEPDNGFVGDGVSSGGASGGASSGASGNGGITSGGNGDGGGTSGNNDGGACEASNSRAEKLPLTMLIALDQSGSMGSLQGNLATRWVPVTTALKAFWNNSITEGITANLRLFPHNDSKSQSCRASGYDTPDVALTPLPNLAAFESVLVDDPPFGFTPTRAVLQATAAQADALLDADPNAKVVVLLVTDGKPERCDEDSPGNSLEDCREQIRDKRFPTYVIGISGQEGLADNVRSLAEAGNGEAFLVSTGNAQETQDEFAAAMDQIRLKLSSCEVNIPPAPNGQTFDRNKVNVTLTSGGGAVTPLGYDQACAGQGWRYDNPEAPTRIELCPQTCEPVKTDPASKIDVEFGCSTRPSTVN